MTQLGYGPYSWLVNIFPPTDYSKFTEMIHQGSLLDNLIGNIRLNGFKWSNYYLESGRYQKILALFLSGHLLAQWRYFETTTYNVRWAVISLAIGLPLNILNAHGLIHILTLKYIGHIALVIFYIECAKSLSTPIINSTLAAYGKMALTHYVGQSVISIFLFYGFGLGLGSKLNLMGHLAVFHIIIATQILYSHWWLKTHQHGPLEQLWRNLYRKSIL